MGLLEFRVLFSADGGGGVIGAGSHLRYPRPRTPTDKAIVEATFGSINTLFCQHVAGYTGSNTTLRGLDAAGVWTLPELQDLFDEWLLVGWQARPHDALRDPLLPRLALLLNADVRCTGLQRRAIFR